MFFIFLSIVVYHRTLHIVPCAIQQGLDCSSVLHVIVHIC